MTSINVEYKANYAIVKIDNGKVNAINNPLAQDLRDIFLELEQKEEVKGVILSGRPHCFSAGLDVMNLAEGGVEGAEKFWKLYLGALQAMVRFSKPFVCAITGFAPAGATILTLCADYRIMGKGEKHRIGMNEFNMSLLIPEMLSDIYAYQLGERQAWNAVQNIKLFNSDEAMAIGLVDESVEVEEVLERAEKKLKRLMNVYLPVYSQTKANLRKGLLKIVDRDIEKMVAVILENVKDPATQMMIEMFKASLKK